MKKTFRDLHKVFKDFIDYEDLKMDSEVLFKEKDLLESFSKMQEFKKRKLI